MIYVRTDPPAERPVTLAQLKQHLRIEADDTAEDLLLEAYLAAAVEGLDGRGGILDLCLVDQGWAAYADRPEVPTHARHLACGFERWSDTVSSTSIHTAGSRGFELDLGPVQLGADAPIEVAYRNGGVWTDLDPSTCVAVSLSSGRVLVTPAIGAVWPVADRSHNAWRVTFRAGYGAAADVPAPIRAAILLIAADLYGNRDGKTLANLVANPTIDRLLAPYRMVTV